MPEPTEPGATAINLAAPVPTLIPATEADHAEIVELVNRSYRGTGPDASWNVENVIEGPRTTVPLLRADIAAKPHAQLLLWRRSVSEKMPGSLLGSVWLEPVRSDTKPAAGSDKPNTWYLGLLAVDPSLQKQQLGRTLLSAAEDYARTHGARKIYMTVVNVRVPLIAWYLRRGYTLTGETEPYPYGDDRFGRPLRDDLHFAVLTKDL